MSDYFDEFFADSGNKRGWGGARPGSGQKPAGYVPPQEKLDLDAARARNEKIKAEKGELELAIMRGEYVLRDSVKNATATAFAQIAQALRAIPDNLERALGLGPEVTEKIELYLDEAMSQLAEDLKKLHQGDAERRD